MPSIATSINEDHLSLSLTDTIEEQDFLAGIDNFADGHVSIATSMSENNVGLASSKVEEEEEEDWVWEGFSQWSLDPTSK